MLIWASTNPYITNHWPDLYSYTTLRYLSDCAYSPVYLVNVRFTLKHPPSTHRQQTTTATSSTDNLLRLIYIYVLFCSTLTTYNNIRIKCNNAVCVWRSWARLELIFNLIIKYFLLSAFLDEVAQHFKYSL